MERSLGQMGADGAFCISNHLVYSLCCVYFRAVVSREFQSTVLTGVLLKMFSNAKPPKEYRGSLPAGKMYEGNGDLESRTRESHPK